MFRFIFGSAKKSDEVVQVPLVPPSVMTSDEKVLIGGRILMLKKGSEYDYNQIRALTSEEVLDIDYLRQEIILNLYQFIMQSFDMQHKAKEEADKRDGAASNTVILTMDDSAQQLFDALKDADIDENATELFAGDVVVVTNVLRDFLFTSTTWGEGGAEDGTREWVEEFQKIKFSNMLARQLSYIVQVMLPRDYIDLDDLPMAPCCGGDHEVAEHRSRIGRAEYNVENGDPYDMNKLSNDGDEGTNKDDGAKTEDVTVE